MTVRSRKDEARQVKEIVGEPCDGNDQAETKPAFSTLRLPHVAFSMATTRQSLEAFLQPLAIDIEKIHSLARSLSDTFLQLAAESQDQFLSTPLSESVLRPAGNDEGR